MNKIDKLIAELCPNGVEWKKIKDVYTRIKGTPITAGKMQEIEKPDGDIRIFAGGKTVINAYEEDIPNGNITRVPAVLVQSRGIIDVVFYEKPFTFKNEMWAYTTENRTSVKFLYYILKNNIQQFRDSASGMGSMPQISLKVTEEFLIPIPPLPIQEEIVRILDTYTALTAKLLAELQAELQARQKQYEYYRDKLLIFNNLNGGGYKITYKTMGEIANFTYGYTDKAKDTGNVRFIRITDINHDGYLIPQDAKYLDLSSDNEKYLVKKGDLLMARTGATYGKTLYVNTDEPAVYASFLIKIEPDNSVLSNRFYWHLSKSNIYWSQADKLVTTGGQPQFNANALRQIKIPIPPLSEQERIVTILDKFDALTNSISEGLPKEIELRKKQYEYYRDKLLTFPKPA